MLKNQGTWVGSFTQMSPSGDIQQDTPSEVALTPLNEGNTMRQTIRKRPADQPPSETVLEYSSLGRGVLFCETGAFSQGSIQRSPVSEFGAELGLIHGTERLRVALIFPKQPSLGSLTLIREHLEGCEPTSRPALTVDQLLGTWAGEAETVFPDLQPPQTMATRLEIRQAGPGTVSQALTFGQSPAIQSQGQLVGPALRFDQGSQPVTVLLLPSGASTSFPTAIQPGQPFFLEIGWLINPILRQRLIRTYSPQGTWVSLTLVIERKL
ncbi:hypothetical protein C7293_31280 [filamentous cyanobacterium CCT1]|nr:hypothetical protein C7293_31280 [filamentous cyanobacterium CCT1]PSN75758.1 hypothetical protein C8B47_30915 [filamentous cyanobacterium CCP4]